MASSYSNSLKIQLMANGEDSGTWGTITNTNWNLMEQAVTGVDTIVMANANYTLTNLNGVSDEARNMVIIATGTTGGAGKQIIAPLVQKFYIVYNNTSDGYSVNIGASSGAVITIPNGVTAQVYCDGSNFYSAQTGSAGNFLVNGNLTAAGVTDTGALSAASLSVSGATALNGGGTSTTPTPGDNSTKIATTAFVTAATGTLGTMSTQNANNVAITGGTINGVTGTATGLNVGFATNATNATTAANGGVTSVNGNTGAVTISTTPTGLGFGGTVWHNVTGSRSFNTPYNNSYSYPIAVSASTSCSTGSNITAYVDGQQISFFSWQFNGCGSFGGAFIIVPPGKSYQLNSGQGVTNWVELY